MGVGPNYGSFIPTTNIWDVDELASMNVNSPEFKELLIRLYQNINNIALVLNTKDTGYYVNSPYVNGQLLYPTKTTSSNQLRQISRLVVNTGALPNTGTTTTAHNLTPNGSWQFTRIYGCATDPVGFNFIPLPYSSPTAANNIELSVTSTNVVITTGSNRSSFTESLVVLEYVQF